MKGKRVLITGGAGFVGSHIADLLVRDGAKEIIAVDNFVRGRRENLSWALANGNARLVEGDIRDRALLEDLLPGVDLVFHQAALRITQCAAEPRQALEVMVEGTFNVLEAALKAGVEKVVAASSASVYGMADQFPTAENHHPYGNRTLYGAAKLFNESLLRSFHEMHGLQYVALRYFNIYGPRMDIHGAYTEVLIRWMERIEAGETPLIFGDGTQTMDFIYVGDVARANILAARSPLKDEVLNIASGIETSLNNLVNGLLRVMGSGLRPEHRPERKVNPVPRRLGDTRKSKQLLGFEAGMTLSEGLKELVAWWRENRSVESGVL